MRVLVVENLQHIIDRINVSLNKIKVDKIIYASNSNIARKELKREFFDLILTEVYIESLTCFEVINMAKASNPNVMIIVITPSGAIDIAKKSLKHGANDFVIRPSQLDKLDKLLEIYSSSKAKIDDKFSFFLALAKDLVNKSRYNEAESMLVKFLKLNEHFHAYQLLSQIYKKKVILLKV